MATEVCEIDWDARRVWTSDERSWPIVDLFDARGRPLDRPFGAVMVIAGEPGAWVSFKLADFEASSLQ